ncbi:MAG: glycosyltransferase family 2 protein [Polaromonas sp.]
MSKAAVYAVVVTFEPDLPHLLQLLTACLPQVKGLVVIDNGSDTAIQAHLQHHGHHHHFDVIALGENMGIATAQNKGADWVRERGGSHLLFFDQDSVPSPNMVACLLQTLVQATQAGLSVAAVGPTLVDRRTNKKTPFVQFGMLGVTRHFKKAGDDKPMVEADFLVSSGMLIPLKTLDQVGPLEDGLFIDNVDLEWCFRARSKGMSVFGVYDAFMEHSVGDEVIEIGTHVIHLHSPVRQYYIMRNRILLYRRAYSPWHWIAQDFVRMLFKLVIFSTVLRPRRKNFSMMLKGIRDGLKGKSGKFH